jgi:hydroxymethylpyrimidine/phosphomethylpyrimidine kinase
MFTTVKLAPPRTPTRAPRLPVVLTIAGSDPSGGAGIEADLKTFCAHRVFGATCITALTAQNTQQVAAVAATSERHVGEILRLVFEDYLDGDDAPLRVIKTGMLTQEAVRALVPHVDRLGGVKLVVDPVMVSTSGATLFGEEAMAQCVHAVIGNAYLVTPNFVEALCLHRIASKGAPPPLITGVADLVAFARQLQLLLRCSSVLVKGGHIPFDAQGAIVKSGDGAVVVRDVLYDSVADSATVFESRFVRSENTHGTGCTLASAIAANLAHGVALVDAVDRGIRYVQAGMDTMQKLGRGNGPLNHFAAVAAPSRDDSAAFVLPTATVLEYLRAHPKVAPLWRQYINHPFVAQVATRQLPYRKFVYFLKQDYYYLINYAQIQCLAASVAPTYHTTLLESQIVPEIVTEIEKHRQKLSANYRIEYSANTTDPALQPAAACVAYCDYLLAVGKREDYLGIKTAIAPCLFGYHEAGVYADNLRKTRGGDLGVLASQQEADVYDEWIEDYILEWYSAAYHKGVRALDEHFAAYTVSQRRMDELVEIFAEVTRLEIGFWDEVMRAGAEDEAGAADSA